MQHCNSSYFLIAYPVFLHFYSFLNIHFGGQRKPISRFTFHYVWLANAFISTPLVVHSNSICVFICILRPHPAGDSVDAQNFRWCICGWGSYFCLYTKLVQFWTIICGAHLNLISFRSILWLNYSFICHLESTNYIVSHHIGVERREDWILTFADDSALLWGHAAVGASGFAYIILCFPSVRRFKNDSHLQPNIIRLLLALG